jgi:hypothetical protein
MKPGGSPVSIMPIDGGLLASAPLTAYGYIENVDFSVD